MTDSMLEPLAAPPGVPFRASVDRPEAQDGTVRIRFVGELDAWAAARLPAVLGSLTGGAHAAQEASRSRLRGDIVVDLGMLTFLDSAGLTGLMECREALMANGWRVWVCGAGAQRQVRRLLEFAEGERWLPDDFLGLDDPVVGCRVAPQR